MKNALVFVSSSKISIQSTAKYNDLTAEQFRSLNPSSLFVFFWSFIFFLLGDSGVPVAYIEIPPKTASVTVNLKQHQVGKYILIKFLSAQNGSIFLCEFLGLLGSANMKNAQGPPPKLPSTNHNQCSRAVSRTQKVKQVMYALTILFSSILTHAGMIVWDAQLLFVMCAVGLVTLATLWVPRSQWSTLNNINNLFLTFIQRLLQLLALQIEERKAHDGREYRSA